MTHANLRAFARWFLGQGFAALRPPADGVHFFRAASYADGSAAAAVVLARAPPYQVELFVVPPDQPIVLHSHPNVDSIECYVSGEVVFDVGDGPVVPREMFFRTDEDGASFLCGRWFRIPAGVDHGAEVGPRGGTFLSFQRWKDGVTPTSVGLDWKGPAHL